MPKILAEITESAETSSGVFQKKQRKPLPGVFQKNKENPLDRM